MKDAKPKPRASKLPLREPAKPLSTPLPRPLSPDHPIHNLLGPLKAAEPPTTHHPPPTHQPPPTTPVAPERDFVRVPNSVVRDALPSGLFKGESKKTYDALYQRTRGAVTPRRRMRATLAEVQAWADVSHNTLKAHLKYLSAVGLLKVHYTRGDNTGAEYEVFTPEEATHPPPTTHHPPTNQILGPPTTQNLVGGGWGQVSDSQGLKEPDKTSFNTKDINTDDEAAPVRTAFFEAFEAVSKDLTGKGISTAELARWRDLFEVLVIETRVAAGRTSVSSVPAFLAEHLRRRLWKKEKRQIEAENMETQTAPPSQQADISQCPDCFGTGMWYPEGFDKGVARCRHERLGPEGREQNE